MKKLASILSFLLLCSVAQAQEKFIYGYILEQKDASIIPEGATLSLRDSTGITEPIQKKSNKFNGYFELLVEERFETLIISKDGYETREVSLTDVKGLIPRDSLNLTRNLQLDLRAYPGAQSTSFITSGLDIMRKVTFEDGTVESSTLFGENDAVQAVTLTQSGGLSDSLLINSDVYEPKAISISEYFDELPASDRINFILADTLNAVAKLFFQQGISTAGKRNQSIGQIPASVVIVSKEEIATQGYQSIPEILENVTGLYLFRDYSWSGGDPIVGMRGFFSQGFNNDIIILVNGVNMYEEYWGFYPFSRFPIAVEAIDRIEIVRGPMSVLYGSGAFFGAINIITNAPLEKEVTDEEILPKHLALSYGSRDTRRLSGGLKYKKDRVSFSFNANIAQTDGLDQPFSRFLDGPTSFRVDSAVTANSALRSDTREMLPREQRYLSASLSLQDKAGLTQYSIDITASSENRGVFESAVSDSNTFCQCPIPEANPDAPGVINRSTSAFGGLRITHSPKESDLNLNFSLFFHEYRTNIDYDAGGNRIGQSSFLSKTIDTEISAAQSWNRISGIVGLNARFAGDLFTTFDTPGASLTDGNNFRRLNDQNLSFVSAFSEFEMQIIPNRLAFTGGLRVEQLGSFNFLSNPDSTTNLAIEPTVSDNIDNITTLIPRAALVYSLNDYNFLKFLYGQALKRPSFGNFTDDQQLQFPLIRTFELNFIREGKIDPNKRLRTRLNVSLYRNQIENLISRISTVQNGQSVFFSGNARNVKTWGGEIGFLLEERGVWTTEISGSLNISEEEQTLPQVSVNGEQPSYSPALLGYFKTTYLWKLPALDIAGAYNMRYISEIEPGFTSEDRTFRRLGQQVDGFFQSNINVRFSRSSLKEDNKRNKLRNLYLALNVSNLFDVDIQYPTTGNNESWAAQGLPGFGRRFFITLGIDM